MRSGCMFLMKRISAGLALFAFISLGTSDAQQFNPSSGDRESLGAEIVRPNRNNRLGKQIDKSQPLETGFPRLSPRSIEEDDANPERSMLKIIAAPAVTMITSLMIVFGLFAAFVWLNRKLGNKSVSNRALPEGLFESMGSIAFDQRTKIHVLRFANRILLVSQNETGLQTLCEIQEPLEIDEVLKLLEPETVNEFVSAAQNLKD